MGWLLGMALLVLGIAFTAGALYLGKRKKRASVSHDGDLLPLESGDVEQYKKGLTDQDPKIRALSAERLGDAGGSGISELLFEAMADKNEEVRLAATAALKKLRDPSVAFRLAQALRDPNKWLPARVAEVLVSLGQASVPALHAEINHHDPIVRGYVIEILGEIGDVSAAESLQQALSDTDANIRLKAAEALGSLSHPGSVEYLAGVLEDPEFKVRIQAVKSLGKTGGGQAARHLAALLKAQDEMMIHVVLDTLRHMGPEGMSVIREAALADRHPAREQSRAILREEGISETARVNIKYGHDQ